MALYSLSICTGVGGLDLGIELAAPDIFTPITLYKGKTYATAILAARMKDKALPSAPIWSDVRTLCNAEFSAYVRARTGGQGIDFVYGGIPCQPHSVAGKQLGADDSRDLWPDTVRILEKYKPWLFFLENVPGMLGYVSKRVVPDLRRLGFVVPRPLLLEASEVGSPQKRERLFILAYQRHGGSSGKSRYKVKFEFMADTERPDKQRRGISGDVAGSRGQIEGEACQRQRSGDAASDSGTAMVQPRSGRRRECEQGRGPDRRTAVGEASGDGESMGHAAGSRFAGWKSDEDQEARHETRGSESSGRCDNVPYWPPGPADRAEWERLIAIRPDLAPATVEPAICRASSRLPPGLGSVAATRTDELRALGNGVVALQGCEAFLILLDRLKEAIGS